MGNLTDNSRLALENGASAVRYLHMRDKTGGLMNTVLFMDRVETWVLSRLEIDGDNNSVEEVRSRLRRISEILTDFKHSIDPDNYDLCQLLSWMNSSEQFYVIDFLDTHQKAFIEQFVQYCKNRKDDDLAAKIVLERITVLYRTRLLQRVFSEENIFFVMSTLLEQ